MYPYNIESEAVTQEDKYEAQHAHDHCSKKVSDMLKHSHRYERSNTKYYDKLALLAKHPHDKKIIKDIGMDCMKHCQSLEEICIQLSISLPQEAPDEKAAADNYPGELSKHMFALMDDVEFYRHLMFADIKIKDKIHELIIDKQLHIKKLLFLQMKCLTEK